MVTKLLHKALTGKGKYLFQSSKYIEAKVAYEEAYNIMAENHYLDHPIVLETANSLIDVLIALKEYHDAERYARICYERLTRPVDTESYDVACAAYSLSRVTFELVHIKGIQGGDIVEAEMLARKALCLMQRIHGFNDPSTGEVLATPSEILKLRGNRDGERKFLLEMSLAIYTGADEDVNNEYVRHANQKLVSFHCKLALALPLGDARWTEHQLLAECYAKEALKISNNIYGPTHLTTLQNESKSSSIQEALSLHNARY